MSATPSGGGGFLDFLASQADTSAGASFSSKDPRPYVQGVTNNVLAGTVNLGTHNEVDNPDLVAHGTYRGVHTITDTATVQQAAMGLYGMSRAEITALQDQLVSAGYIAAKDITTRGIVDAATAKAYGDLLQDTSAYNAAGNQKTVDQMLAERSAAIAAQGGVDAGNAGAVKAGHVQQVSNSLDLAAQVQNAAQSRLGRKLKPSEVQKFVTLYHGLETAANSRDLSATATAEAGGNTTVVGAPNVSTATDDYISRNLAPEAGAHDVAGQFANFLNLIKGI